MSVENLRVVLDRNIGWTNSADAKAGFLIALCGAFGALLLPKLKIMADLECIIGIAALLSLSTGTILGVATVAPRLKEANSTIGESNLFFEDIAAGYTKSNMSLSSYSKKFRERLLESIELDIATQIIVVSVIASRKYALLKWSSWATAFGVIVGIFHLILTHAP